MKALILGIVPVGVAGGMYVHGDFAGGQIYNLPVEKAYHELSYMQVPQVMEGADLDYTAEGEVETVPVPDHAIKWVFKRKGVKLATVTADASAKGSDQTRVVISYSGESLSGDDKMAVNAQNFIRAVAPTAMQEAAGAAIENRSFNMAAVQPAMAGYVAAHAGDMMQQVSTMMDESIKSQKEADKMAESRAAMYSAGMPTSTAKPMMDLSKDH